MIEILKDYPDAILAIEGKGTITSDDYKNVLIPEANARIERHGAIRLLCHLGSQFDGLTPGAAWSDLTFGLSRWNQIGRMAVVTDVAWIKDAVRLFAPFFHHPVRTFANDELAQAQSWIKEDEEISKPHD
jgi:hypothetical protein